MSLKLNHITGGLGNDLSECMGLFVDEVNKQMPPGTTDVKLLDLRQCCSPGGYDYYQGVVLYQFDETRGQRTEPAPEWATRQTEADQALMGTPPAKAHKTPWLTTDSPEIVGDKKYIVFAIGQRTDGKTLYLYSPQLVFGWEFRQRLQACYVGIPMPEWEQTDPPS